MSLHHSPHILNSTPFFKIPHQCYPSHVTPQKTRERCTKCFFAVENCYCCRIKSFDPKIRFVILIQYREARKHIATGRLSHLCLKNSELIIGYDYTNDLRVNAILEDPQNFPMVLYPGAQATNLSQLSPADRGDLIPKGHQPVIFLIDGTWISARKIMQKSTNLQKLPQICFDPPQLSRFRLRKQPKPYCFSTVEAIHHTLDLLGPHVGFDTASRTHDHLLEMFNFMEDQQIRLTKNQRRFLRPSTQQAHLIPSSS